MTSQQKARQLIYDMSKAVSEWLTPAAIIRGKECAKICIDEITQAIDVVDYQEIQNLDQEHAFWDAVKAEIDRIDVHARLEREGGV